jgi:hypothetical protein
MFELKLISRESVPVALEKAERYRLLKEPWMAESICRDILQADPENNRAVVVLLLAITDQFDTHLDMNEAYQLRDRIPDQYDKQYYSGLICERKGKAILCRSAPDESLAYEWLREAMDHYEKAEAIRPQDNDDSILRWNTCVRLIIRYRLVPRNESYIETQLE